MSVSKQMQELIKSQRVGKNLTRHVPLTPKITLAFRKLIDKQCKDLSLPDNMTMEIKTIGGRKGEWYEYTKENSHPDKVVLCLHGGGFMTGSPRTRRYYFTRVLAAAKMNGFSASYRQYPEAKYPAPLRDALEAFKGLVKIGYKPENIYLVGESAGSVLCLTMTEFLKKHHQPLPGKIEVFSPPVNFVDEYPSRKLRDKRDPVIVGNINQQLGFYFSKYDRHSPYISAIYGDFHDFPTMHIDVGSEEVLHDDAIALEKKCKESGVNVSLTEWQGCFHSFIMFPSPEAEQATKKIGEFLRG